MKRIFKFLTFVSIFFTSTMLLSAQVFNSKLTPEEEKTLESGKVLIKNINYQRNMCLNAEFSETSEFLIKEIKKLSPKYLAEVIQIRPYKGNENLAEKLEEILNNVPDYAGIPYYSEKRQKFFNLYDSAEIKDSVENGNKKTIKADLKMLPFGTVNELIEINKYDNAIIYVATNQNKLNYLGKFDCVWPEKMKICIYLVRDGENWVLYGIGGVNAPRIPFFTERIETSFINRIKTFCDFIFNNI